jgi:acetyltransferase-like isoleucine patch superfamily enzyme
MYIIGKHSYSYATRRGDANDVTIENYCSIAEGVIFDSGFNHESNYISTFPFNKIWSELKSNIKIINRNIMIGNDVWIGENSVIFSNVKIGDGAIIGFGSIITKDVEPYSVVVGANKIVRYRYTDEQIEKLLKIKWWNWSDDKVKDNVPLLHSSNINEFIDKHYKP